MFFSARCIAASRLAFSLANDSAQALKSDTKRYSATRARSVCSREPMTSGRLPVGQGRRPRRDSQLRIERQQLLVDRFIRRPGPRAVVKKIKMKRLVLLAMCFRFNDNLPNERSDGVHRSWNGKKSHRRKARIRQPGMDALADGPDSLFAG